MTELSTLERLSLSHKLRKQRSFGEEEEARKDYRKTEMLITKS